MLNLLYDNHNNVKPQRKFRKTSSFALDFLILKDFLNYQKIQFLQQFSLNLIQLMS